ncbi:SGNH/GDSL hydrolase family protein [Micromonospora sp. MED01]|uniref:SGNH/GDSL hydrolase family protein n=1 Tax=Micromonospora alfalfae TaxID=2911212 RepID=UPI001EE7D7DC|nr:SGNH/GDSL hydrolase family protein [Micromonospora alfalfae]MCG5460855.1 SGNH/GDSL hydrolase family protein [Micromonospora alfalfae]
MSSPLGLDASSSVASIVVIGDSNSEGTGATSTLLRWQYLLQQKLRARLQPGGVTGAAVPYISASPRVSPPYGDYPRTATGGVTTASFGLGLRAAAIVSTDTVTFSFTGTRAKLFGTKGATVGKYSIKLDGGAETVVDGANASVLTGQLIWDSGTLTAGAHSVVVARAASTVTSPGPVYPEGLMTYNGDTNAGVRVVDAARHGSTLATFTGSNAWWTALGAVEGAQLLIMPWGANDSTSGTTASAFKIALNQMIADARSAGFTGTVLLLKMPKRGTADATLWANYMTQIDAVDLADANVLALDLRPSIPDQGTPAAIAAGLYADEVHFSNAGHALIADLVAAAILGDEPSEDGFETQVWAAFGANLAAGRSSWSWTDLSSRVRAEPARIRVGQSAGARQVSPSSGTLTLDSPDGALIPGNPLSAYYPNVDRGTPMLQRIRWAGIWYDRFAGYADQWQPQFTPTTSGMDSFVRVTASGILRRLSQGAKAPRSAPARYLPTTSPVAYWTLEDGQSVREGSATVGRSPMFPFTGTHPSGAVLTFARWGRGELASWVPEVLSRSGSAGLTAIWARVVMPAVPGRWVVDFMYRSGTDAGGAAIDVNPSYLGGALGWPQLMLLPDVRGVDVAMNGEPEVTGTAARLFDDQPHHIRWDAYQDGTKVSWNVYVDGVMVNFGTTSGNMTLPSMDTLGFTADTQAGADMVQGHIAVWVIPPPLPNAVNAAFGYAGETASARIARLCAEEGIPVTVFAGASERLGPQGTASVLELLQDAADADEGILAEDGFGLAYIPHGARYRQPVTMTVDLATYRVTSGGQTEVLAPTLDDQRLRNRWTISRPDGIEATADNVAHQQRVGLYEDSATLNVETDGQLRDHATLRVYQGTLPGLAEQTFPLDLAANRDLVGAWLACRVGRSRIVRSNPPFPHPPGVIDRLVTGWSETISPSAWSAQVAADPAAAWDVAVVDGPQRVAADGATLSSSVTSTATTMLLTSTAAMGLWTVRAAAFPFDLMVGGEQVTVTAITGASSPQTATVVRSVNGIVKAHAAGTPVQVAVPAVVGL